jgi:hypothetical protein
MRIHKEQRKNLPMTRLRRISQRKRRDAMLECIRECDETALSALDATKLLRDEYLVMPVDIVGESVDVLQKLVLALLVVKGIKIVHSAVPEG